MYCRRKLEPRKKPIHCQSHSLYHMTNGFGPGIKPTISEVTGVEVNLEHQSDCATHSPKIICLVLSSCFGINRRHLHSTIKRLVYFHEECLPNWYCYWLWISLGVCKNHYWWIIWSREKLALWTQNGSKFSVNNQYSEMSIIINQNQMVK
jgi:hypothetical protein